MSAYRKVILIRADASVRIGSGHVRRMSVLSTKLQVLGYQVILLCNNATRIVFPDVKKYFDHVIYCENENDFRDQLDISNFKKSIACIFFDHYFLDFSEHGKYRKFSNFLCGIDDLANRSLDWNLLFDINFGRSREDYADLIAKTTKCHFGENFQIIHSDFFKFSKKNRDSFFNNTIENIFISFGGTDPLGLTAPIVTLIAQKFPKLKIQTIIGTASPNFLQVKFLAKKFGERVQLFPDANNVPQLMSQADLGIGAGGTMTWERNIIGLPTIMLIIANNQIQVGEFMEKSQAAIVLDARKEIPFSQIENSIERFIKEPDILNLISANSHRLSCENGAENIASCIDREVRLQKL